MKKRNMTALLPLAFIFHFVEITVGSFAGFLVTLLLLIVVTKTTAMLKKRYIFMMKIVSAAISIMLAKLFIVVPNPSWFNPFSMEMAMVFTESVLLVLLLVVRFFTKAVGETSLK